MTMHRTIARSAASSRAAALRSGWRRGAGVLALAVAIAASAGVTAAQGDGGPKAAERTELDPTCVLGPAPPSAVRAQQAPWLDGLLVRSDALNRQYGLGRYGPGGDCADVPDWFRALVVRSDELNRIHALGDRHRSPSVSPRS